MKKTKRKSHFLLLLVIINVIVYIVALAIPITLNFIAFSKAEQVQITHGEIDFHNTDISTGNTYLDGEWRFYPNQWIITDKENSNVRKFEFINPKYAYPKDVKYASYSIILKNFIASEKITLDIAHTRCAYRIFVNDVLCFSSGELSKTDSESRYTLDNTYAIENLDPNETTIVIEVSGNFSSGLQVVPVIRNYFRNKTYSGISMVVSGIVFGLLLASFFSFLAELILEKSKGIILFSTLFFLSVFSLFLFLPPGVSIINLKLGYNYELSYLIIFCIIQLIFTIISFALVRKIIKEKIYSKKFPCYLPIIVFSLCTLTEIILFIFGLFDYYVKLLLCISVCASFTIFILGLRAIKVKKNDNYIVIYVLLLSTFTLALSILFFTYSNIYHIDYLYVLGLLFTTLFLSIFMSYNYNRKLKYQAHIEQINELQETISQSKASILLSQIRPHFLYNTLNTIVFLCRTDPKKAEDAIISFSKYLRANMNSLDKKELIPFSDELNHIRNYVKIEQLRFGNKLKVVYKLSYTDFFVPPLSIQPIVENAIKHGITKKAEGGKLTLITSADDENVYITIQDTGVGFDVEDTFAHYKSTSIGLHNITKRIKMMSNGVITFESQIGKGTTVNIIIPKNK